MEFMASSALTATSMGTVLTCAFLVALLSGIDTCTFPTLHPSCSALASALTIFQGVNWLARLLAQETAIAMSDANKPDGSCHAADHD